MNCPHYLYKDTRHKNEIYMPTNAPNRVASPPYWSDVKKYACSERKARQVSDEQDINLQGFKEYVRCKAANGEAEGSLLM